MASSPEFRDYYVEILEREEKYHATYASLTPGQVWDAMIQDETAAEEEKVEVKPYKDMSDEAKARVNEDFQFQVSKRQSILSGARDFLVGARTESTVESARSLMMEAFNHADDMCTMLGQMRKDLPQDASADELARMNRQLTNARRIRLEAWCAYIYACVAA